MKILLLVVTSFFVTLSLSAQNKNISLQAAGLTCSMCSNAINKSLKTLPFVESIQANIKTSTFDIAIKPGAVADYDLMKKKVEDAGFFVAKFLVTVPFTVAGVKENTTVEFQDKRLRFVNNTAVKISAGDQQVRIVSKGFISAKEAKKLKIPSSPTASKEYYATI
ncbi:MAG: heavy-metal-associated domain-containing protein [Ferruginibacter sp.]